MESDKFIVKMQFGSHIYGTNLPSSDLDFKAVHIPPARDILLQRVRNSLLEKTNTSDERNTSGDTDFESFSLQQFMRLLLEGQTIALDMLFTPDQWIIESSRLWVEIVERRESWLHSGVSAFVGYCRQQANKYGIKGSRVAAARSVVNLLDDMIDCYDESDRLGDRWHEIEAFAAEGGEHVTTLVGTHNIDIPIRMLEVCGRKVQEHASLKEARKVYQLIVNNYGKRALQAEQNDGVDWKAMMHAVRVCHEAQELLKTHRITFPRPEAELLLGIRQGRMAYKEVAEMLEREMEALDGYMESSTLPKEPDREKADELILSVYSNEIQGKFLGF